MTAAGIAIGLLLFVATVLWFVREFKNAPLYPDDYDSDDWRGGRP
jgi:hypothetical protein